MGIFSGNKDLELSGRNIYGDKKNRVIYLSPITKKAYVLKPMHVKEFNQSKSRFILPIIIFIFISGIAFDKPIIDIPYAPLVAALIALAVYGFFAYRFYYKFLPTLTVLPNFVPEHKNSFLDTARRRSPNVSMLRLGLLLVMAVLFILNGRQVFERTGDMMNLYLNYGLSAIVLILSIVQFYALMTRHKAK